MENNLLKKAKKLSQKLHDNTFRVSGETYFEHTQRVVDLLKENGVKDENILISAYLHHILEKISQEEIQKQFGEEIACLIVNFKKLVDSEISGIDLANVDDFLIIQTYLNLAKDPKTLIIRLADKTEGIKTAIILPKDKGERIAKRALYLYAPICRLLGLEKFVGILEDEAFKVLNPKEYYRVDKYVNKNKEKIKEALDETAAFTKEILLEKKIKADIEYRIKSIFSIYKKSLQYLRKGKDKKLTHIHDIAAMRILVSSVEKCYEVEDVLKQAMSFIEEERDDYIQKPKPNGYQSIHNIFKLNSEFFLEIQIKTKEMHEANETGLASHAFYKMGEKLKKSLENNPHVLKDMRYSVDNRDVKIDQFSNKVYVFTPKGDIVELPKGSNLIDFAYAIHAGVGNSAIGAKVNGNHEKLTYELQNGDRVEIKTVRSKLYPSTDWLKQVKTQKAKDLIRKALRQKELS